MSANARRQSRHRQAVADGGQRTDLMQHWRSTLGFLGSLGKVLRWEVIWYDSYLSEVLPRSKWIIQRRRQEGSKGWGWRPVRGSQRGKLWRVQTQHLSRWLLPPRMCISRKLELEVELRLKLRLSHMGCECPQRHVNCTKCPPWWQHSDPFWNTFDSFSKEKSLSQPQIAPTIIMICRNW